MPAASRSSNTSRVRSQRRAPSASQETSQSTPLFEIDTTGSSSVRHSLLHDQAPGAARLRKGQSFKKPLKSDQILAARSSVPALTSRAVPSAAANEKRERHKLNKVNRATKERLKKLVGRDGQGEGLWGIKYPDTRTASKQSPVATYDAWQVTAATQEPATTDLAMLQLLRANSGQDKPKPPVTLRSHALLGAGSKGPCPVSIPHPGMSYNPAQEHHQALLSEALRSYTDAEAREERGQPVKDALDQARLASHSKEMWEIYEEEVGSGEDDEALGMVDPGHSADTPKKLQTPKRKTRQQRTRKIAAREEHVKLQDRRAAKRRVASVLSAPTVIAALEASKEMSLAEKATALKARKTKLAEDGLTRLRSGPNRVPNAPVTFQLGEELADNLRTLQPEGNLWKEWVGSNMRRGKVPTERANESKKGGKRGGRGHDKNHGTKTVEKYAYKNWSG